MDAAEADWLAMLAAFDLREGWKADAMLSAVDWLEWACGFARSTAKERLRVAHELRRRPSIRERFTAGMVSYSKVRAMTRITDGDDTLDQSLLAVADAGTAADLDRAVARWQALQDQRDPRLAAQRRWERRGVRRIRGFEGMDTLEIVAPAEDIDRLIQTIDAYADRRDQEPVDEAPAGDAAVSVGVVDDREPVDEAPAGDAEPVVLIPWWHRRLDALLDLAEEGLAHAAQNGVVDLDRTMVSVGVDYETLVERADGLALLNGGVPLTGEAARRLACDASLVRVVTRGRSEILDVGRKTRQWPRAIRRAIMFRHGNRCSMPGCQRRILEIHHCFDWTLGGETAVDVGVPVCGGHHRLVHEFGWTVRYDTGTGVTTFTSPEGRTISTRPLWEVVVAA